MQAGTRLGTYQIVAPLGAGGMGEVYRARDTTLGRDVAIKVLPAELSADAERLARLRREAQLLASLSHPHVAVVHGFDQSDGRAFLVMELVEGEGLDEIIGRGPVPLPEALQLAAQIAAGLEAAHEAGIIHRDLKPANVRITPGGEAKVLDFGLAKGLTAEGTGDAATAAISLSPTLATPTVAGVILGTAAYMSPEQARGGTLDRRTDIWSFGCVLYEMLTGERPFGGQTVTDVLASLMKDEPDLSRLPAGTPSRLRQLLRRCLMKKPRQRLRDIGDARLEIEDILAAGPEPDLAAVATPRSRAHLPLMLATVAVATAVTVLAAGSLRSGSEAVPAPRSLHFEIAMEPGQLLVTDSTVPAVSPRGDTIAYTANTPAGRRILLRRLDQVTSTEVRGAEGGRGPFFSPAGDWLGFVTEAGMFKVSVDGGNAVPLVQQSFWSPRAVWRDERTIIAQGRPNARERGLIAIDANDGGITTLTSPDAQQGESIHEWPLPLPDGTILFQIEYTDAPAQIGRYDPAKATHELLGIQASGPIFLIGNALIFERAGGMFAVAFDAAAGSIAGVPAPVLPGADSGHVALAADGTAVYVHLPEGGRRLVRVDRRGTISPLVDASAQYRWVRVSPDGTRIVVGVKSGERNVQFAANFDIWIIDIASQRRWLLPDESFDGTEPVWTPDGLGVVHSSGSASGYRITRNAADGRTEAASLLDPDFDAWPTDISPDGAHLLLYGGPLDADVWILPLEGDSDARILIGGRGDQRGGRFSPDGRFIAYASNEGGREEVFVQPFPQLDQRWTISSSGGRDPAWARDGSEIFFRRGTTMLSARVTLAPTFSVGAETVLFESALWVDPFGDQSYDVMPDGQHFAMYDVVPGQQPRLRVFTGLREQLRALR